MHREPLQQAPCCASLAAWDATSTCFKTAKPPSHTKSLGNLRQGIPSPLNDGALCLPEPLLLVSASCVGYIPRKLGLDGNVIFQGHVADLHVGQAESDTLLSLS